MHNAISHHPLTNDLSSGPLVPGQLSTVYILSVILYGMGQLLGHFGLSCHIFVPSHLLAQLQTRSLAGQ